MINEEADINAILKGRQGMYSFLAAVFLNYPPKDLLKDIYNGKLTLPEIGSISEGLNEIREFSKKFNDFDSFVEQVKREYTELFILPGEISLYQSIYENENPYGKVTLRIKEIMKKVGYKCNYAEPEDHIGVQLSFMAETCKDALDKRDKIATYLSKQKDMLNEMKKWVPKLCSKIESNRSANFYRGIAKILKEFIKFDLNLINCLL